MRKSERDNSLLQSFFIFKYLVNRSALQLSFTSTAGRETPSSATLIITHLHVPLQAWAALARAPSPPVSPPTPHSATPGRGSPVAVRVLLVVVGVVVQQAAHRAEVPAGHNHRIVLYNKVNNAAL